MCVCEASCVAAVAGQSEPTCAVDEFEREDCGFYGIKSDECREAGCCWKPNPAESNTQNVPWCFFSKNGGGW